MIHYQEFQIKFVPVKKGETSQIIFYPTSNVIVRSVCNKAIKFNLDKIKPMNMCVVNPNAIIDTGSMVIFNNEIHIIGNYTISSGYGGYYSDKNQWFYANHKGIVVATSNESLGLPTVSNEDIDWCINNYNKNDNKNVVFVELFADPNGSIVLLNENSVAFSLKAKSDGTIKVNKTNLKFASIL